MSMWRLLQKKTSVSPIVKTAAEKSLFASTFVKTAAALGMTEAEAISALKKLEDAKARNR